MLKTSLLITGDSSVARKEVADLGQAVQGLGATAAAAAPQVAKLDVAQQAAAASSRSAAEAANVAAKAQSDAAAAVGKAADRVTSSHTRMGASGAILQHVVRSTSDSFVAGLPPSIIFGEQLGRLAEAAALSGGALGAVGTVLSGPFGIAVTAAVSIAGIFVGKLFETESASDAAKEAVQRFADVQTNLASAVDKANGKLAEQNRLRALAASIAAPTSIREGYQSVAGNIKSGFDDARSTLSSLPGSARTPSGDRLALTRLLYQAGANPNGGTGNLAVLTKGVNDLAASSNSPALQSLADKLNDAYAAGTKTLQETRQMTGAQRDANTVLHGGTVLTADLVAQQIQLATAHDASSRATAKLAIAQSDLNRLFTQPSSTARDKSIETAKARVIAAQEAVDAAQQTKRAPRTKKPADTTSFTAGVANDIASLTAQFSDAPTFVEKARAAVARLDKDIAELQKKKPPNFQTLIDQATAAKGVIQANLTKPLDDYIKTQGASLGILKLQAAGLVDQAAAQEQINTLEKQQGTLSAAQRDIVLSSVQAIRAEQREIEIRNALNAKYLTEIGSIKSAIEDATQAFVRGDLGQFIKTPGKLIEAFQTLQGQKLFDKLFDGVFRDLQDQANGTSIAKDAAKRFGVAVDDVTERSKATANAVAAFKPPVEDATRALAGFTAALQSAAANASGAAASPALAAQLAQGNGVSGPSLAAQIAAGNNVEPQTGTDDIVVTANRLLKPAATAKPDYLVTSLQRMTTSIAGLFTNPDSASRIGASIGKYAGKGLEGAATGSIVAGLGKTLGLNLSQSGAQIGGAVGGILGSISKVTSALPGLGAAIAPVLSVVGGLVGKLFAPKAQPGGATVSSVNGSAAVSGTVGSDAAGIKAGNSLGASVSSGINQIAQQLGGTIGAFNVEIGKYKDDLRVNVNGRALGGVKGSGAVGFGDDENAAVSYAISQAIAQGAVQGLDAAVRKALASSTDADKALKEALGVKNLEVLMGGVQASLKATFDAEAATAKERLRLAQTYGLDIVAVEKTNADQLAKVVASSLKQQVGSLQTLVTDLTSGSLFDGTAMDKITAINAQIVKTKADLDAGVDGAGDTLAKLYQDRLTASKDAYGTTDAYAADRTATLDDARAAIAAANARITAAQSQSDPALTTTNAALDENNDQNAQIIAALAQTNALLAKATGGSSSSGFDLRALAAY